MQNLEQNLDFYLSGHFESLIYYLNIQKLDLFSLEVY